MVNIASFDRMMHAKEVVSNVPKDSFGEGGGKFKAALHTVTAATNEMKQPATQVEVAETPDAVEVKGDDNSAPLTLEYLLPTSKVPEESKAEQTIDLAAIFTAASIDDLVKLVGGDFNAKLLDGESLDLSKVANALGMKEQDLNQLLQKLLGGEAPKDLWAALQKMDEQLTMVLPKISAALNDVKNATLTKKEAQSVLALFKFVELAAPKTDLLLKQELQTSQVKDWLATLASQVTTKTTEKAVTLPFANKLFSFKQPAAPEVTQPVTQVASTLTTAKQPAVTSITLPAAPQAQGSKFVEEFQTIMSRAQFANNAAGTRLLIKLYPENLGTIRVELVQKDGMFTAKLLASTALGKQMLDGSLHQLKQGLVGQNIQVDRIDVAQALSEPNKGERGHQFGQQTAQDQQKQQRDESSNKREDTMSFEDLLAEMEALS